MLLLLAPGFARAEAINEVVTSVAGEDVAITFRTDGSVGRPTVRSLSGRVTLVFGASYGRRPMTVRGDGQFIESVNVRSGVGDTTWANIGLPDGVRLAASRVRIETQDDSVVVRIAKRAILPNHATSESPTETTTEVTAPQATPAAVATPSATPPSVTPPSATPASPSAQGSAFAAAIPASAGTNIPVLLFVTLVLAAGYFGVRLILQRRGPKTGPAIDIIASKRIGARHQLLIVRAFGRDHLLSVQGNTTTRIATSKSSSEAVATTEHEADYEEEIPRIKRLEALRDDDGALGLADLRLGHGSLSIPPSMQTSTRSAKDDDVQPVRNGYGQHARKPANASKKSDALPTQVNSEIRTKISLQDETRFGAELMKLVRASVAPPAQPARIRNDDATSGIVRLRKQASGR